MTNSSWLGAVALGSALLAVTAAADNRIFTYTYEPATEPRGDWEFEQSITARAGRHAAVGQENYQQWEFRTEIEHGFTDRYTAALYVNDNYERFTDPATGATISNHRWTGVSFENRYLVLDPADHAVGLTLYLEPTYDGENAELEERIIIGQRHGNWKWAVNLTHATEWADHFREQEGELELTAGLARQLTRRWSLGFEIREHNELPQYEIWENTAVFVGPVISYRRNGWWAALSVMPQIYGANFSGNPDENPHLELEGHERLNVRLLVGFTF
jgi:hypothetical protein